MLFPRLRYPAADAVVGSSLATLPSSLPSVSVDLLSQKTPRTELRIMSGFSCVARGLLPRASFRFIGCCWWRPLAVDGGSGTSRGHAWSTPVMRRPGARGAAPVWSSGRRLPVPAGGGSVTACTVQGMARVRSGQARPAPWFLTGVSAEVSRIKRDLACTCTRHLPPVLVALRAGSRLRLEGRTRTLSGPSPDLSQPGLLHLLPRCDGLLFRRSMQRVQPVRRNPYPYGLTVSDRDYPRAVLPTGRGSSEIVREWLVASYVGGIAPDLRHVRKSG